MVGKGIATMFLDFPHFALRLAMATFSKLVESRKSSTHSNWFAARKMKLIFAPYYCKEWRALHSC